MISLILSGNDGDGTEGANAVRMAGGLCLVQDPRDAVVPSMPIKAIEHDHPGCLVGTTALVEVLMHVVGAVREASTQASG